MWIKRRHEARRKSCILLFRRNIRRAHDDDEDDGGDGNGDGNAVEDDRSCSISAVHFMLRIVTHAREPWGGTNISRTLYDLRNINIFLLPTSRSYDSTHFLLHAFLTCVFYASRNYKRENIVIYWYLCLYFYAFKSYIFLFRKVTQIQHWNIMSFRERKI